MINYMNHKIKLIISAILIIVGVAFRLLPHLWNFVPVAAIALFAGVYLGKRYAIILPVVTMLIGDFFIGFYEWPLMLAVYSSFIFIGLLGAFIRKYKSMETILASSIFMSVIFFLVTNFAVWQFSPWYAKTFSGLFECYTLALPFFRNTFLGDLFYVSVFFGCYEAFAYLSRQKKKKKATV